MTDEEIDRITLAVYRARLEATCKGDADSQVTKDKDEGQKQANRSKMYRPIVVETLVQAGLYHRFIRLKMGDRPVRKETIVADVFS